MTSKQFFQLSEQAINTKDFFITSDHFLQLYKKGNDVERNSAIYHYVFNNVPAAFQNKPLLYENIKQYISMKLDVHVDEIRLVGSSQIGFSLKPQKYGDPFSKNSDLDFAIINRQLFENVAADAMKWRKEYEEGIVHPGRHYSKAHWDSNYDLLPNNMNRGFVDVFKVPGFNSYNTVKNIYVVMDQVKNMLLEYHGMKVSYSSVRAYSDIDSFYGQVLLNVNTAMSQL